MPKSNVNTISSLCSVASYYGISLEILRSSEQPLAEGNQEDKSENLELKQLIQSQLVDYTHGAKADWYYTEAATYKRDPFSGIE